MDVHIKLSAHALFQALAVIVQVGNLYSGVVPEKYQPVVLAVVALAQAIMGLSSKQSINWTKPESIPQEKK